MLIKFYCEECSAKIEAEAMDGGDHVACPACGCTIMVPMEMVGVSTALGPFRVLAEIGEGGMGKVFLAEQMSLQRKVALKVLSPTLTRNEDFVRNFMREIQVQASLSHPNIAAAIDAGEDRRIYYLAMEYIDGRDVETILEKRFRLGEEEALRITRDVASGLMYAWKKRQIVHRDIKPGNIMIDDLGTVRLLDLGLATSFIHADMEEDPEDPKYMVGTPQYMPPEQARGEATLDFRSDVYALGGTLYHMLTGEPPHSGSSVTEIANKQMYDPPIPPGELNPDISTPSQRLLARMLNKSPLERFSSWDRLIEAIDLILDFHKKGAPKTARTLTTAETVDPASESIRKSAVALFIGMGLAAAVALGFQLRKAGREPAPEPEASGIAKLSPDLGLPPLEGSGLVDSEPGPDALDPAPPPATVTSPAPTLVEVPVETPITPPPLEPAAPRVEPTPDEPAEEPIWTAYASLLEDVARNPDKLPEQIRTLRLMKSKALSGKNDELAETMNDGLNEMESRLDRMIHSIMDTLNEQAQTRIRNGQLPQATGVYENYDGPFQAETKLLRQSAASDLRSLARQAKDQEAKGRAAWEAINLDLARIIVEERDWNTMWNRFLEVDKRFEQIEAQNNEARPYALRASNTNAFDKASRPPLLGMERDQMRAMLLNTRKVEDLVRLSFEEDREKLITVSLTAGTASGMLEDITEDGFLRIRMAVSAGQLIKPIHVRELHPLEKEARVYSMVPKEADFIIGFYKLLQHDDQKALDHFQSVRPPLGAALVKALDESIELRNSSEAYAALETLIKDAGLNPKEKSVSDLRREFVASKLPVERRRRIQDEAQQFVTQYGKDPLAERYARLLHVFINDTVAGNN